MTRDEAIDKMWGPADRRPNKRWGGVMQIWITRACDKSCFGCTQGSNLAGKPRFMPPELFEKAVQSLTGGINGEPPYFGTIGVFGGNPCMHPDFPQICEILAKYIPFAQRGLWSNKLLGHGAVARKTFNPQRSNLNVHLDQEAWDEFKRDWPEARPFGLDQDSRHSPPYVALQDVVASPAARWRLISGCDINREWSALVGLWRGELRGWFCEIAAAQAMLHQDEDDWPDLGVPIEPGWWNRPLADFGDQVEFYCHRCGIPLRGYGELAMAENGQEQASPTHADIYRPKRRGRPVQVVTLQEQLDSRNLRVTDYLGTANK